MTLSAIGLMDPAMLMPDVQKRPTSGMELLDISDEIDQIMQQMGYGASGGGSGDENNLRNMMVCQNWLLISRLINSSIRAQMHLSVPCRLESICWHIPTTS